MKLESLVSLGINDIPTGLGRILYTPPTRVTAVEVADYQKKADFHNRLCKEIVFEQSDHTGIYTNEVKPEPPKFGTIDSAGRWLAKSVKECIPSLTDIPFIKEGVPTEKGWYNATLYDDTYAFRYWRGTHWSAAVEGMHLHAILTKSALKRRISTVEDGAVTKWRKVPLLLVFYEAAEEYERSKTLSGTTNRPRLAPSFNPLTST